MKLTMERLTKQFKNKIAVDRVSMELGGGDLWVSGSERCREDDDTSLHCNDY